MPALTALIATIAESLGYGTYGGGTTPGASIFENREPDAPYQSLTIYQTGGAPDTQDFDGNTYGEQRAQLRFRDPDQAALQTRILGLYGLWAAWKVYPALYVTIKASSKPMFNYPTQSSNQGDLWIASFNVRCIVGS